MATVDINDHQTPCASMYGLLHLYLKLRMGEIITEEGISALSLQVNLQNQRNSKVTYVVVN